MNYLIELDKKLLLFFNSFHTPFWDTFFETFSGKIIWVPLAILIIGVIVKTKRKEAIWILLFVVATIALADQISVLIKNTVERPRPSHEITLQGLVQLVNGHKGGRFGFVSSHATNAFAFALFTSLLFRWRYYTITIFAWAVVNSYSRMYLAMHYPADIIGGTLLGLALGGAMFYAMRKLRPQTLASVADPHYTATGFSFISLYGVLAGVFFTVLAMLLTSAC